METKLKELLTKGELHIKEIPENNFTKRPLENKWSKKEILGHLIDSAINNLKRFTEIQFSDKPYIIITYKQKELVLANHYQTTDSSQLLKLWLSLNYHILHLMENQTNETLAFEIIFDSENKSDLRFLMTDYVEHLEYHLNQILN